MEVMGTEVSSHHEITWSGSAAGSASFNPKAGAGALERNKRRE